MAIKYINIFQSTYVRPFKIDTNWDFWFEKKPSGNPETDVAGCSEPEYFSNGCPAANPTTLSYNASVVKIYNAMKTKTFASALKNAVHNLGTTTLALYVVVIAKVVRLAPGKYTGFLNID
jgi:hypothetical protein